MINEKNKKINKIVKSKKEKQILTDREQKIKSLTKWDEFREKRLTIVEAYVKIKRKSLFAEFFVRQLALKQIVNIWKYQFIVKIKERDS